MQEFDNNGLATGDNAEALNDMEKVLRAMEEAEEAENSKEEADSSESEESAEESTPNEEEEGIDEVDQFLEQAETRKKDRKETALWKAQRKKFKALAEKDEALRELQAEREKNLKLERLLADSLESGAYHYGRSAYAELERAKALHQQALDDGDKNAVYDATVAIAKAQYNISELEKLSYNNAQQKQAEEYRPVHYQNPPQRGRQSDEYDAARDPIHVNAVNSWLEDHPYLQPNTANFDKRLFDKVTNFSARLSERLSSSNSSIADFSEEYFDILDQFISKTREEQRRNSKNIESISHVGSVRNSYSTNSKQNNPSKIVLSPDEKLLAFNLGISEKAYLKSKLEEMKNNKI